MYTGGSNAHAEFSRPMPQTSLTYSDAVIVLLSTVVRAEAVAPQAKTSRGICWHANNEMIEISKRASYEAASSVEAGAPAPHIQ